MYEKLKRGEEQFIRDLFAWDAQRRPVEWILSNVALFLGVILVLVIGIFTLQHLTDRSILLVTVPGSLLRVLFVGLYLFACKRTKERHRMALILKKHGAA